MSELATCDTCDSAYTLVDSCHPDAWSSVRYGDEHLGTLDPARMPERCRDCNAARGGYHHTGCTIAQCGDHGGQAIGCAACDLDDEADELADPETDLLSRGLSPEAADVLAQIDYRANPEPPV